MSPFLIGILGVYNSNHSLEIHHIWMLL